MNKLGLVPDQRIAFANSLRGIAAISVLLAHYGNLYWNYRDAIPGFTAMSRLPDSIQTPALVNVLNDAISPVLAGPFGVGLFFIISGFVIPFSLGKMSRLQFLIGRVFRIWPTYFVGFIASIAIVLIAAWIDGRPQPFPFITILEHSFVMGREIFWLNPMDGVVWTLEIEVRFYLLAAIIYSALASGSRLAFLVPAALLLAAWIQKSWALPAWMNGNVANELVLYVPYVIYMFVGVAFNFYYRGCQSVFQSTILIVFTSVAAWFALRLVSPGFMFYAPSLFAALLVFFFSMLLADRIPWNWSPLAFLAEISFSLYAVHALTGYALMNLLLVNLHFNSYVALLAAVIAALALATVINKAVERPSRRLGKHLISEWNGFSWSRQIVEQRRSDTTPAASGARQTAFATANAVPSPNTIEPSNPGRMG
jgi:peptidoglycan/LPS O-acetylase OafA/YrhL